MMCSVIYVNNGEKVMSEIFFYLLVAYLPFQLALNLASDLDLLSGRVLILLFFLLWLLKIVKEKKLAVFKNQTGAALILFLVLAGLSLAQAAHPDWAGRKWLFFVSIFPLFFLTGYFASDGQRIKKIIYVVVGGATLSALVALAQFLAQFIFGLENVMNFWALKVAPLFYGQSAAALVVQNPSWLVEIGGRTLMRAIGLFPDPHMLAFYLGLTLPFALTSVFYEKKYRPWLLVAFCLLLAVVLLTFSRGGYLGLAASLFFMTLVAWHKPPHQIWCGGKLEKSGRLFLFGLAGLLLVIFLLWGAPVAGRFLSSFDLAEGSNFGRLQIWAQSLSVAKEHWLLGVGLGNYPVAIDFNAAYRSAVTSHNLYLDILAEMGIFGLLVWLWFLISVGLTALKKMESQNSTGPALAVSGALIYFTVHSFFETPIFNPTVLAFLMIVVGLSVNLSKISTVSSLSV